MPCCTGVNSRLRALKFATGCLRCQPAPARPACALLTRRGGGIRVGQRELVRLQVVALGDVLRAQPNTDLLDQDRITVRALDFEPGVVGHDEARRIAGDAVELPQRISRPLHGGGIGFLTALIKIQLWSECPAAAA